jgi:isoquinoline 1-oxidoreductase alpha subunit
LPYKNGSCFEEALDSELIFAYIHGMATLNVNGKDLAVDADPSTPILWALRDTLGLTGTKFGCGQALCGACTVHLNGAPIRSCVTPMSAAAGQKITTIEAIGNRPRRQGGAGRLGQARRGAMRLLPERPGDERHRLLKSNAKPTDADIDQAMAGNICRCGTYTRIRAAIKDAGASLA